MPRSVAVLTAAALCAVPAAAIACGAADLMTNTDANIVAYRKATAADVPGIAELTAPLEEQGVLIPRPLHELTRDVHQAPGRPRFPP